PAIASKDGIYAQLRHTKIAKLVLNREKDSAWDSPAELHTLLGSVPMVKTLVLNFFNLNQDTLKALNQTPGSPLGTNSSDNIFPKLENVEIYGCTIKCPLRDLRPGFQGLLANHPIQRLMLGRYVEDLKSGTELDSIEGEDEEVIEWLESAVPRFRWLPQQMDAPEMIEAWQLWDI
ncbi:hypothetical protein FRC11_003421, partial [Ceratobasidium sp. 423]